MDLDLLQIRKFMLNETNVVVMYGMTGTVVPTALCGHCGKVMLFAGEKSRKEIGEALNSHLRHYHKEAFADSAPPTMSELKAATQAFLPHGVDKTASANRGFVLPPTDPLRGEIVALFGRKGFTEQVKQIYISSWMPPERDISGVVAAGPSVKVSGYGKAHHGWIAAPNMEQWSKLTAVDVVKQKEARERVQYFVKLADEYSRTLQIPGHHLVSAAQGLMRHEERTKSKATLLPTGGSLTEHNAGSSVGLVSGSSASSSSSSTASPSCTCEASPKMSSSVSRLERREEKSTNIRRFEAKGKSILYVGNLSEVPFGICGCCGSVYEFAGKDLADIAEAVYDHLRRIDKDAFGEGGVPTTAEAKRILVPILANAFTAVGTEKQRGLVIPMSDPMCQEIIDILLRNSFTCDEREINLETWLPLSKIRSLAGPGIMIDIYHKNRNGWVGVANDEQWRMLTNEKETDARRLTQHFVNAATTYVGNQQALNHPQNGVSQDCVIPAASEESWPLREAATSSSVHPSASEVLSNTIQKGILFKAESKGVWMRISGKHGGPPSVYFPSSNDSISGGMELNNWSIDPTLFTLRPETKRGPTMAVSCPEEAKRIRLQKLFPAPEVTTRDLPFKVMTKEEEKCSAYLSRRLARRGRDRLLFLACLAMLHTVEHFIGKWSTVENSLISDILADSSEPDIATGGDGVDHRSDGLNTSLDDLTLRDYASKLAKLIRMILDMKLYHYQLIEAEIESVPCEKDVPGGDVTDTQQFKRLAAAISKTFYLLAVNPHLILPGLARQLLFEHAAVKEEASHQEEHDIGDEAEVDASKDDGGVRMRKPVSIRKYFSAWLYGLKAGVALEIQQTRLELMRPMGPTGEMIVQTDRPFGTVLDMFKSKDVLNVKYVAKMISLLNTIVAQER